MLENWKIRKLENFYLSFNSFAVLEKHILHDNPCTQMVIRFFKKMKLETNI